MTRPNIVRADTLDLQDPTSPTAAEHAKHPPPNGNAPHLAAQVQHVLEERHSEEKTLADAWDTAANLDDQPAASDAADAQHAQDGATNDQNGEEGAADGEGDADDDMMDRISSSPSIEDGGYSLRFRPPLHRLRMRRERPHSASLSPASSTPGSASTCWSFNQTADMTPDSSPFLSTPLHMPRRPKGRYGQERGPANNVELESNSSDVRLEDCQTGFAARGGDWKWTFDGDGDQCESTERSPIVSPFRRHSFMQSTTDVSYHVHDRPPSLSGMTNFDLESVLLPTDDPLLSTPISPTSSTASWESMPETISDRGDTDNYFSDEDDDDDDDAFLDCDAQFIDFGWGCECLHDTEDIDFEFVYALHTFVATVEGQANATKGDTMVLLDDSNSYWWLVRVVKDSSIGYLPAEHIETPTERLARLNKHRNIDLSATMLSDNSEKSRNPLKKAMRRRNAKTVQFAAPTYVEASDYDYSTEDEENLIEPAYGAAQEAESAAQEEAESESEAAKKAEIEHPEAERRSSTGSNRASFDREQAAMAAQALAEAGVTGDGPHGPKTGELGHRGIDGSSIPTVETEAAPLKSKRTRNTDSFLKDDKIDTVRITLTPGLLREEQAKDGKSPSIDTARSSSFEELKSTTSPVEQTLGKKDEKKKKEDKPKKSGGMLSGLFKSKKKDKKTKEAAGDADAEREKVSTEISREGSQRGSPNLGGKLSPIDKSSITSPTAFRHDHHEDGQRQSSSQDSAQASFVAELEGSRVAHEMGTSSPDNELGQQTSTESEAKGAEEVPQSEKPTGISKLQSTVAPITNMLHLGDKEGKPAKAKKAKQRVELDDFDSPADDATNPFEDQEQENNGERLSESPVEISSHTFMHGTETIHIPDAYHEDSPGTDTSASPESLTSSPSIIDHPAKPGEDVPRISDEDDDSTPTARSPIAATPHEKAAAGDEQIRTKSPATPKASTPQPARGLSTDSNASKSSSSYPSPASFPSPATSQQSWSDESLKAWLEDGSEVRDMLVLIHDKSGIEPVAADHPLIVDLFTEQRKGVQHMMGELDGLLGSYLQRKGVRF
ncbi:hypothetical protein CERZMDRAFT_109359 [Cercospora zeae-maydis SCOH1-5]|uniref:SH3 domain-containing protein n=1 Tax=Cercospora zeae-maydis SCOH1-5 TaxID=717836 RepID=A0A6A6FTH0_9PEZI|nr:hypothetical protein CERZMDRAFT_109359 [Cercospora zeae-maydis SCOH1-5]